MEWSRDIAILPNPLTLTKPCMSLGTQTVLGPFTLETSTLVPKHKSLDSCVCPQHI
jgi:hypothetical protein